MFQGLAASYYVERLARDLRPDARIPNGHVHVLAGPDAIPVYLQA